MSKHTPGTWTQTLNNDESAHLIESEGRYIADVHRWAVQPNHLESEANARLIAAAPELLEALKDLLPMIASSFPKQQHEWLDAARAAIAKAEGVNRVTA